MGKLTAVDVRSFGSLSGDDFLKSTFDPAKRLREQGVVLEAIENPGADREAAFDQIVNMSYKNLDWTYSQLRKAKAVDEKARTEVAAAYEFFSEENFIRIGKWLAAHEQTRVSDLSWSKKDGVVRVTCREDGALMNMKLQHSELAKWNTLPQLLCF
ncbi:hypothetical protein LL06_20815 [Hoeflea sp. BAL378]|nr:hypothetical protein LL06_20815 [Hoeflea sp. BAL378]